MSLNRDFSELLSELNAGGARYLLVGGYALSFYGRPRATGDLDLGIDSTPPNAETAFRALANYGAPLEGVAAADFAKPGTRERDIVDADAIQAILDDRGGLE